MLKWILRILLTIICLIGLGLFLINIVAGTGESQKKGLEDAMSQLFKGQTHIGLLNTFNIFPQFKLDASNITINITQSGSVFRAENALIAFGFYDMLASTHRIEALKLMNASFETSDPSEKPVKIVSLEIVKTDKPKEGSMDIKGELNGQAITASLSLESFNSHRPSFALRASNPLILDYNRVNTTANLVPYMTNYRSLSGIKVTFEEESCALPEDEGITADEFMQLIVIPQSQIRNKDDFAGYCEEITTKRVKIAS